MILVKPIDAPVKCSKIMYLHYLKVIQRIVFIQTILPNAYKHLRNTFQHYLPNVVIKGLPNIKRAVINADEKHGDIFELLVEGTDFRAVLATREVDGIRTKFATAFILTPPTSQWDRV